MLKKDAPLTPDAQAAAIASLPYQELCMDYLFSVISEDEFNVQRRDNPDIVASENAYECLMRNETENFIRDDLHMKGTLFGSGYYADDIEERGSLNL
jgi:hypothetical protein